MRKIEAEQKLPSEATEVLADFVCDFSLDDAPSDLAGAARYCVLDTVGSALGAVHFDDMPGLVEELSGWSQPAAGRGASIWGYGKKIDVATAVLLNGCMNHVLEFDDNHSPSKSHPGGVCVPSAWAVAEAVGATGRDLLEAVVVGYEVMGRVGKSADVVSMRKRGWHNTGIIGPFGSAAAVGRLLGLSREQLVSAFGLAGTQSAGLWAFLAEGASCKKLNCAKGAVNGTLSAMLAKGGMTGPKRVLDAKDGGLYPAVADSYDMKSVTEGLGEHYEIMRIDKKPYPSCRSTHPSIDAALLLKRKCGIDPKKVEHVVVDTYEVAVMQCGFTNYPCNAVEAKFSIPFVTAACFVAGKLGLDEFKRNMLDNPEVRRIAEKTVVREDKLFTDRYRLPRWGCRMTVTMKDGSSFTEQIDDTSGGLEAPMTREQEREKFVGLALQAYPQERVEKVMDEILRIDTLERLPDLA